ncbi:MAG: alpha-galactosidase [Opitutaceae bacterium]|jgi:alpha-galactosidase|nr:alpha-galactosidase [Opitutaceae bacterium]
MPIEAFRQTWFLHTRGTSYALYVSDSGHLHHGYWGPKVTRFDVRSRRVPLQRAFSPNPAGAPRTYSLDAIQAEYPFAGGGDFRQPAFEARHSDGTCGLDLKFKEYKIIPGKPSLEGLPATYVENDGEAQTLEITLLDEVSSLQVVLAYTCFAGHDAVTRSVRVLNRGRAPVNLLRVLSASVDLPEEAAGRWLQLSGAWSRERRIFINPIRPGVQSIESRRGSSSHHHNPFFCVMPDGTDETHGFAWAMSFVYSGNFLASIERDSNGLVRLQIGLNPGCFGWHLSPGESFQAPEAVLVFSDGGLGAMSNTFHQLYRNRLCRGFYRDRDRPVLINNWEATYFDFDEDRLLKLAGLARSIGVEMFVVDDGWFGRRDDDTTSLGDWTPHARKFPRGLASFAEKIIRLGMKFGIWLEPEMVSPDSNLYRAHPDWCLHLPGRPPLLGRGQLMLDLSRPEVCDALFDMLIRVLESAPVSYVKWDMNRNMTDAASAGRAPEKQCETAHRHMLGLYGLLERLTRRFPDILFESCAGGGGRFDPGMLYYMPQTWTSDNTDALARAVIQEGTSLVYPLSTMAAHISASPNHQTGRHMPLRSRALTAATGTCGLELDIARCAPEEIEALKLHVADYKCWRTLLRTGHYHRLRSGCTGPLSAWEVVAPDGNEALVFAMRTMMEANAPFCNLRLRGLTPDASYHDNINGAEHRGDELMNAGLLIPPSEEFHVHAWHFIKKSGQE